MWSISGPFWWLTSVVSLDLIHTVQSQDQGSQAGSHPLDHQGNLCLFSCGLLCFSYKEDTAVIKNLPASIGDARGVGLIPGSGRFPGIENGKPLQYSCLDDPMDSGVWRATVHAVAESDKTEWLSTCNHKQLKSENCVGEASNFKLLWLLFSACLQVSSFDCLPSPSDKIGFQTYIYFYAYVCVCVCTFEYYHGKSLIF